MQNTVRPRLEDRIRQKYGDLSTTSLSTLSQQAKLEYTTIARFLGVVDPLTRSLRTATLRKLARALGTTEEWLRDGQGAVQIGIWPLVVQYEADTADSDPCEQVGIVLGHLSKLPAPVVLRACRAATAAVLETVVSSGRMIDGEAYECLVRLDAHHRGVAEAS